MNDLRDYFHLPIEEAAKKVDLCPTVLKKTCRKAGLARWPHRKVNVLCYFWSNDFLLDESVKLC